MIYIETNNEKAVVFTHFLPFDGVYGLHKSEAELRKTGYLVDAIPDYTEKLPPNKAPELHYDGSTFSWILVDVAPPEEPVDSRLTKLENEQKATNDAVLGLMSMIMKP